MKGTEVFSISEFAQLSRTTRDALIYYDKIGLLRPVSRGDENNYRFYSGPQLGAVNLIRTCRDMGMSLSELTKYKGNRSAEGATAIIDAQIANIDKSIADKRRVQRLMHTLKDIIVSVRGVDESAITVRQMPAENIVMGQPNDYGNGRNVNDAILSFYRDCQERYPALDLNYPVWGYFNEERIKNRDWRWPDNFYFYSPEGQDQKPAGQYAIGYARGGYGDSDGLYNRMLAYIYEGGYVIDGPVFEEYPLNEISVGDHSNYLMRVSIMVRSKG